MDYVVSDDNKSHYSLKKKDKNVVIIEKENGENLEVFTFNNILIKFVKEFVMPETEKDKVFKILRELEKK